MTEQASHQKTANSPATDDLEIEALIQFPVPTGITYPSYIDFDRYLNLERLIELNPLITDTLNRRLSSSPDKQFYTGPYKLEDSSLSRPGSRMVYLSQSEKPDSYFDLDKSDLWRETDEAAAFPELMAFIKTLPFKATGRMLIIYDNEARPVSAHRDHVSADVLHEFIWFRTNKRKPFYMLNQETGERLYISSYSAWFDTVNQFHGGEGVDGLSFSIRVDGEFTDEFRALIPSPPFNKASTPAYWASQLQHNFSVNN